VRERNYFENLSVEGRILLKWIFKKRDGGMDWIDVAQDRSRWRVVNTVMNLKVQKITGNSVTEDLLAFQVGLCFMELVRLGSVQFKQYRSVTLFL